jgi:hypothetical protein
MKTINMKASFIMCVVTAASMMQAQAQWSLTGNAGTTPGTNFIGTTDSKTLQIRTSNKTRMTVTSSGSVGIGTASPVANVPLTIQGKLFGGTGPGVVEQVFKNSTGVAKYQFALEGSGANAGFAIGEVNLSSFRFFIQDGTGNVGIGTPTPVSALDVKNDANPAITVGTTTLGGGALFLGNGNHGIQRDVNQLKIFTLGNPSDIIFSNGGAASPTERMRINTSGNVGIGTNNPGQKLAVTSAFIGGWGASIANTANSQTNPSHGLVITACTDNGIFPGQNLFVGLTRPDGTIIGAINQQSASSVGYATTSDTRLKSNISETNFGIADIMKIQVRDYDYNDDKMGNRQTGFLAQQLYTVFPNAVAKGGDDAKTQPWMVDYGRMTPLVIKGMQDQQNSINALQELLASKVEELAEIKIQLKDMQDCLQSICNNSSSERTGISEVSVSSLQQNQPNPFSQTTVINYNLSNKDSRGMVLIRDTNGNLMKSINVNGSGKGQVTVNANELSQGTYTYTLVIEGKSIDTKLMVITK